MNLSFRQIPLPLAMLPGLVIGWVLADSSLRKSDSQARGIIPIERKNSAPSVDTPKVSSKPSAGTSANSSKIRLSSAQIRTLRECRQDLRLDFSSFDSSAPNSSTDANFDVLRVVLSLTPKEETALRGNLTRLADALRNFEKTNISMISETTDRIAFTLPPRGKFHENITATVLENQVNILGKERAKIFAMITGSTLFTDFPPEFGGRVEFVMMSEQNAFRFETRMDGKPVLFSSPSPSPSEREIELLFGRFGYLVDTEWKRRLLEKRPVE